MHFITKSILFISSMVIVFQSSVHAGHDAKFASSGTNYAQESCRFSVVKALNDHHAYMEFFVAYELAKDNAVPVESLRHYLVMHDGGANRMLSLAGRPECEDEVRMLNIPLIDHLERVMELKERLLSD